jgi:hypothetical protein
MDVLSAARSYTARGLFVVPIPAGSKGCRLKGWQNLRLNDAELPSAFRADSNIGVLLGEPSGWLVDVDLDCDEAVVLAEQFLPPTPAVTGRDGRSRSHWWYVCENAKTIQLADPQAEGKATTLELRSTGGQTVVGPSVHPDGSRYDVLEGEPARVPYGLLEAAVRALHGEILSTRGHNQPTEPAPQKPAQGLSTFALRPGDDFNRRGDLRPVLEDKNWVYVSTSGYNELWRRPGKADGHSATFDGTTFFVHTQSAAPQFEPKVGYSKFEVFTRLAHDGDHTAAATALLAEGYGQSLPLADLSGIHAQMAADPQPVSFEAQRAPVFPDWLLDVPGFVGEVMRFTLATARRPQPVLSLFGALALQAVLSGRRIRDAYGNRTNLYVIGLAKSAKGKDRPRKVNREILTLAGLDALEGNEDIASDSGLLSAVEMQPSILFQLDEIGRMLRAINDPRKAPHLFNLATTLMRLYSSSDSVFKGKAYADARRNQLIDQPCVSVFGTTVPDHFFASLSSEGVTDGFLARMLVVEGCDHPPRQRARLDSVPDSVIATARWWGQFNPGGNLHSEHPTPQIVEHTSDADAEFDRFSEIWEQKGDSDDAFQPLWARCEEKACRLALVYTASRDRHDMLVDREAARWACEVVDHLTATTVSQSRNWIADSEFERKQKRVARIVERAGRIERQQFTRKTQWLSGRERNEIAANLLDAGLMTMEQQDPSGGRPKTWLVWLGG